MSRRIRFFTAASSIRRHTSLNGERANPGGLTAAHRTLAFGTNVRVTNRRNGRSITVRINELGPFVRGG